MTYLLADQAGKNLGSWEGAVLGTLTFALVFGPPTEPSFRRRELEDWFQHLQQQ